MIGNRLRHFKFWCQSVLPIVYDDSLSYYEVLCRVVKYINDLIDSDKEIVKNVEELRADLDAVQNMLDNFDTEYLEKIIREYLATMIFVEISNSGYFLYFIPDSWEEITFETTGLDVQLALMPEYGHLVLSY